MSAARPDLPTGFLLHPASPLHDTGWGHPEHQGRLRALASTVGRDMVALHGRAVQLEARSATEEELRLVHTETHVDRVRAAVERAAGAARATRGARAGLDPGAPGSPDPDAAGTGARDAGLVALDPDTRVSPESWEAALGSVGAVLTAVEAVLEEQLRNAFVATRPPGHHATAERAMGFCLFNHVAVAARWLRERGHADRVLIVDWDVHHGNGTQDVFWRDPSVFFLSLHQFPHWPGSGRAWEVGEGPGAGFTANVEMSPGLSGEAYLERYQAALDDVFARFTPDFVLVSSGFDCLAGDPLGGQNLQPVDLHRMTRSLLEWAGEACDGRVVATLEGGYDPARTGLAAAQVLRALAGVDPG